LGAPALRKHQYAAFSSEPVATTSDPRLDDALSMTR